ncbi:MAG: TonB-dependent receptor [Chitinophagaceae bacterium]|nr:TonB-dependent receptor [Chitinophagaceae bacterium]
MKKKQLVAKLLLAMKITFAQIALAAIFACSLYANESDGQNILDKPVTIFGRNIAIDKVIAKMENQTGVEFIYSSNFVATGRKISCSATEVKLGLFIETFLKPAGIDYRILNEQIILFPLSQNGVVKGSASPTIQNNQAVVGIMVSGVVSNDKDEPLEGATVTVKGTGVTTLSNSKGFFRIEVPDEKAVLVVSYAGFASTEAVVGNRTVLSLKLSAVNNKLEDVVVIGYGSQKQTKVTSAIGSITAKDINGVAVTGLDQALQGQLSGVQVTQNSGEPGGSISIRVRGVGSINSTNEPLYVVDGVPYGSLNAINPNDIERIDVLKDAAAASIYGSRASNGVVLVTTKHAKKGLVIGVGGYVGVQNVAKKLSMLNGPQFAKLANENLVNGGVTPNPQWSNPQASQNNDWQSSIFQTAPIQNYNVSISNGGDRSSTLFSLGYFEQEGVVVGSDYQRYTVRLNTDYSLSKKIKVGIILNGAFDKKKSVTSANDFGGILNQALYMQPTSPIRTTHDGLFGLNPDGSLDPAGNTFFGWDGYAFTSKYANVNYIPGGVNNPLYTKKIYLQNPSMTQQILASAFAEYEMVEGLKLKSTMNLTYGHGYSENARAAAPDEISLVGQLNALPNYGENWDQSHQWNWINTISYNRTFGNHTIGAVAGVDAQKYHSRFVNINTSNAPADQQSVSASDVLTRVATGFPSNSALLSYFGRLSYDYKGKYLFSGTVRRDGSSNFGPENKYGVFESGSVGWRVSEEEFMKSVTAISDLKIRASYGTVGNQNIPGFKYLSSYSSDAGTYQYTLGTGQVPVGAVYQNNTGVPDIHWEKSTQTDIGLDFSMLRGKLFFTADYYIKKLNDLLGYFPVPNYTGVFGGSILKNGFSMQNKGLELALGYNQRIGQVNFNVNANFSTLNNKITQLTDNKQTYVNQSISVAGGAINDGGAETRTNLGGRIATFYGYVTDGIIQTPDEAAANPLGGVSEGDRKYRDINKDGTINASDKVALGNGLPKYTFGTTLKAEYNGIDISVLLNGQAGVQIANMTRFQLYNMRYNNSTGIVNGSVDLLNSWHGKGTSNTLPRNAYTAPTSNRWFSDFFIENGNFLRVRNVQIGYTFREAMMKNAGIKNVRIYLAGQNIFTFTKYTGYDPEVGSPGQSVLQTGADFGRYPLARMFTVGFNCQF